MFLFSPLSLDSQILFIDGFDGVLRIRRSDMVPLNLEVFVLHWVEIVARDFHGCVLGIGSCVLILADWVVHVRLWIMLDK